MYVHEVMQEFWQGCGNHTPRFGYGRKVIQVFRYYSRSGVIRAQAFCAQLKGPTVKASGQMEWTPILILYGILMLRAESFAPLHTHQGRRPHHWQDQKPWSYFKNLASLPGELARHLNKSVMLAFFFGSVDVGTSEGDIRPVR